MSKETGDLRKLPRKRVLMHATIVSADGPRRVRVVDLTPWGAHLAPGHGLSSGSDVLFKRDVFAIAARVVWIARAGAGLEFYRKIDSIVLAATEDAPESPKDSRP